tara:strand:- start:62 stop:481 length:420 start_codon:yes stop_codon:yes gene_type:complete
MAARQNKNDNRHQDISGGVDGWTEYKRLVLSELERLNEAVEKLKDQCVQVQSYIQNEISKVRESLLVQISQIDKNHPSHAELAKFEKQLMNLEQELSNYYSQQQEGSIESHKWGFWAAVISIIGSLVVSIISIIIALNS